jgi:hypothetical protein
MRRMMMVGMLVAILVVAVAGVAVAKGQGRGGHDESTFNFKGTVVEAGGDAVVVAVEDGNKKARAFEGQQVSFAVDGNTRIKDDDDTLIAAADLTPGEEVRVQAKAPRDATEFTARKIDVKDGSDD